MPLQLYFDQDSLDARVVGALRSAGIDVLTSEQAGQQRASDEQQLTFASRLARAIYTANTADFARLHGEWMRAGRAHAGIIVRARQRRDVAAQIRGLRAIANGHDTSTTANLFLFLEDWL